MSDLPPIDLHAEALRAEQRLRPYVRETPLVESEWLRPDGRGRVFLKLENLQHTGSFKLRGALNKLLTLTPAQRAAGVVAASSGNHGAGVAYAMRLLGVPGVIFVTEGAAPAKLALIARLGASIRPHGDDTLLAEAAARRYAEQHGMTYVSPYNDPQVIAGQASIAVELDRQLPRIDAVLAAVGGGGLISGIASYLKAARPGVRVVGCQPERAPVMAESLRAGRVVDLPLLPTLSDATAGGIEPGAITFAICRALLDELVLVGEEAIAEALRSAIEQEHLLIEGAAGVAVAAYLRERERLRDQNVVIVICGANIGAATLRQVLSLSAQEGV